MTITGGTALSKDEIDRMVADAEKFAAEDHSRREAAETRNAGDQLSYQVDKSLEEWGDKVPEPDREELKKLNAELKEALKGEDVDKIKAGTDAVMQKFQGIGQAMYQQTSQAEAQQAAAAGGGGSTTPGGESENDVVTFTGIEPLRPSAAGAWMPSMDVYETEDRIVATLELPGIEPDGVEVSVEDSTLTVSGKREFSSEIKEDDYRRLERRYGSFTRAITLPQTADTDKVEAHFDKGVLTIEVPKVEKAKTKKIQIKAE
jgi:HSP20 family molecular chaperone IbpA